MRLRIAAVDAVFYPDVLVHCQHISNPATTMEFRPTRNGSALEAWPHGSELRLEGLGLSLGWDEVYAGVGLR